MSANDSTAFPNITTLAPGQCVSTSFGPGIISAVDLIDSIVYVAMATKREGLYLLRPDQIGVDALGDGAADAVS